MMTENAMISAEDFGQLYASLETLEIQQITSALIKIPKLRDEIKKRLAPRKRRSKAVMLSEASIQPVRKDNSIQKRKPRKSTPTKLTSSITKVVPVTHSVLPSQKESSSLTSTQLPLDLTCKTAVSSPLVSPAQLQAPFSTQSLSTQSLPNSANTFLTPSQFQTGHPLMNQQSFSHWYNNWCRMTTGFTGLHKPALPLYSNLLALQSQSHIQSHIEDHIHSQQDLVPSPHSLYTSKSAGIDPVDKSPGNQIEEDPSHRCRAQLTATPIEWNQVKAEEGKVGSPHSTSVIRSTDSVSGESVTCPDCDVSVPLSSLQSHLEAECTMRASATEEVKTEDITVDVDELETINWEKCTICSIEVPGQDMMKHIDQQHGCTKKLPFQCDICLEKFRNKSTLKRHKITHTEGGGHKCGYCDKIFAKRELVKRHEMLHTDESRVLWPCPHCSKGFSNKYNLAVHERIHTGELPFKCPECSLRFRVKCSMQNHMRSKHQTTNYNSDMESSNQSPCSIASTNQSNTDVSMD